tara:strand:- start:6601 stop:7110 length:510 start_codon:yes stop_codon:yes gene_type:complete
MGEDMFIKDKKKKQLTDKQLEGLKKGREKMAEKRMMKKKLAEKKKELADKEKKANEENKTRRKYERKQKKETVEKSQKAHDDAVSFLERKKRGEASLAKFNKLKMATLDQIKSSKDLSDFENIMSGISNDMARNPDELYSYLDSHADRLLSKKGPKKKSLPSIKEEDVE